MKAHVLVRNGAAEKAFELQDRPKPAAKAGQVCIAVECFGLNFADVMARLGLYKDAPPLPAILGYEVVGRIESVGEGVDALKPGQRVVAFTRFSGYAEFAVTDWRAVAPIPEEMDAAKAAALATQYGTAYYCACEMVQLHPGDRVLVQAAAGGVGTALVQLAKRAGCEVFGTAGGAKKLEYLKKLGVDHPIDYRSQDFAEVIQALPGNPKMDVVFDSIGGKTYSKGMRLLNSGGRMVSFGAAQRSGQKGGIFSSLKLMWDFGIILPVVLIMHSRGAIGVNMLRLADNRPDVLQRVMHKVVELATAGEIDPQVGGRFSASEIGKAHHFLESRESTGKVAVFW